MYYTVTKSKLSKMETHASTLYCIRIKNILIFFISFLLWLSLMSFLPPVREAKRLTFSYSASNLKRHKTTLQNPQELQYHRKPQKGFPKETHGEKGRIVQEIRVQQISERPFPMTKMD